MFFLELLKANWTLLGLKAPWFSWVASVGLFLFPAYFLHRLYQHYKKESALYIAAVEKIAALKKEHYTKPGRGLSLAAYDAISQHFGEMPSLADPWNNFKSRIVVQRDSNGEEQYWASESAEHHFNESSLIDVHLNKSFYVSIPSVVTGTGLLFTFLAILVALLDVKIVEKKFQGIDLLIMGLSGKFVSSVAALFSATIFMLFEKPFFHRLNLRRKALIIAIDNYFPTLTSTQALLQIHNNIAEQTKAFKIFNSDLSLTLQQSFSASLGPTLENMISTMQQMNGLLEKAEKEKEDSMRSQLEALLKNLEQSIQNSLQQMGESFSNSLSGSTMDQFNKIAGSLGNTSELIHNMNGQSLATQAALNDLINHAKSSTAAQFDLGKSQVEALTNVLRELMMQLKETTGNSMNEMSSFLSTMTYNISEKVSYLGEQMATMIKESSDNATGAAQDLILKAGDWTSKSTEQLDKLVEKYQSQVELTAELNESLKGALIGFNNSLNKYSEVTSNLRQITSESTLAVNMMTQVSSAIKDNQEALKIIAGLVKEQIQTLHGANQEQNEIWKGINTSMQNYKNTFQQVDSSAKEILLQISDNLTDYTQLTEGNFKNLVLVSNEHFTNAYKRMGQSVNELEELLQDLNDILNKKRQ